MFFHLFEVYVDQKAEIKGILRLLHNYKFAGEN